MIEMFSVEMNGISKVREIINRKVLLNKYEINMLTKLSIKTGLSTKIN